MKVYNLEDKVINTMKVAVEQLNDKLQSSLDSRTQDTQDYYYIKGKLEKFGYDLEVSDVLEGYKTSVIDGFYVANSVSRILGECFAMVKRLYEKGYR